MHKLAILHTTPATVEPLKALAAELVPDCTVVNFLDDSILPQLAANGGDVNAVAGRMVQYARYAEQTGANVILSACSSVGEVVAQARALVSVPVVRIDEAMAEQAVRRGPRVGVAATMATTLNPTVRLLCAKAAESGQAIELRTLLVEEAYQALMAGDAERHDALLVEALAALAAEVDVVVLAQASMARVLTRLPAGMWDRFLTSPRLAMGRVKALLEAQAA